MKILQVAPFFHPHAGGVESHVRNLTGEFVRQGHEVTVLTSRYDRRLPEEETIDGVRVVRARTLGVAFNTPIDPGVSEAIRRIDADVAHLHYPPPLTSYFAVRGLRRHRIPTCLTYHCDLYLGGPAGRIATGFYERLLLRRTLSGVQKVIVHTRSYGLTSTPLRGRALEIIPSSVDLVRFRPEADGDTVRRQLHLEGKRVLAFTGRLVPHKGVDGILRALADLPDDVALLVVGRGPRLAALTALAGRLGVEERVRFCPEVSDEELPNYLRVADVFVFPSQNRLEGFGLVVAEAMACGLPVIVADMPGVREVIEPGREGLLVEPLIENDLTEKIRRLLDDPERRARMGKVARQRAEERFALPTIARSLIKLYEGLIAAG
ncbi:MAG: glycosyltransferase family 4 protein [Thermoplasmata archaeon]|nr:glycosyltransferase family 4 protein [Thermoplasmata archaeon]